VIDEETQWDRLLAETTDPEKRAFLEALRRARPDLTVRQGGDGQWRVIGIRLRDQQR
jgi:hypothetical protein